MVDVAMESMEDLDPEGAIGDEEVNEAAHAKLLKSIDALDGKRSYKNEVRGAGISSSNLDLLVHTKKESTKITPQELKIKKKSKLLSKPLSALETEKAKRQIARDVMEQDTKKWEPIVHEIRMAPQIQYSDRPVGIEMYKAMQPQKFSPRTPLEVELYEALGKSEDIITPDQPLTKAERDALKAMSVEEAMERRKELMVHHELLSRMQIKAKRVNKIKSRRYRKNVRKEKEAQEKKKMEDMRVNDPEAFLEKMALLDKARMEERLTLKHKAGGKFARYHKAYSKYDDRTREAVQEMVRKGKELTKKRHVESSDDDEDDEEEMQAAIATLSQSAVKESGHADAGEEASEKTSDLSTRHLETLKAIHKKAGGWLDGPTKFVYQEPHSIEETPTSETQDDQGDDVASGSASDGDEGESTISHKEEMESGKGADAKNSKKKRKREESESEVVSKSADSSPIKDSPKKKRQKKNSQNTDGESKEETDNDDKTPSKKKRKKTLEQGDEENSPLTKSGKKKKGKKNVKESSSISTMEDIEEEGEVENTKEGEKEVVHILKPSPLEKQDEEKRNEEEEDQSMAVTMEELFEDEDVVEQFAKDKEEEEEKRRPKKEDTKLPGWGSWSGPDYKEAEQRRENQRRKKFQHKERHQKEKDEHPNIWLNPKRDEAFRQLQPKRVPFPYTSAEQYAAACRQPVSRGFVREIAHKILIKPEVVNKLGHIIKPLDKDDFFKKKDSLDDAEGFGGKEIKYAGPINFRKRDNRLKSRKAFKRN